MLRAMRPVRRHLALQPDITASWSNHRVDRDALSAFLAITGLPTGSSLPILYPHTFGFRLSMAILTHPVFPVPIWGVLQTRNRLEQHRPIPTDARLDFETRVLTGRAVAKGAEFDLHTAVRVAGEVAWESLVTFFARGRYGEPAVTPRLADAPTSFGPPVAQWLPLNVHHRRFGSFTGDYNGIHLWDAYARRFGFSRALFHPPRVLGECLARLPACADDEPARLDVWLKGPVAHGVPVVLCAGPAADPEAFALYVEPERPCIVGRVQGRTAMRLQSQAEMVAPAPGAESVAGAAAMSRTDAQPIHAPAAGSGIVVPNAHLSASSVPVHRPGSLT
jgi:hypothetical protein